MNTEKFYKQFEEWKILSPKSDGRLRRIAEIYLDANDPQQKEIEDYFENRDSERWDIIFEIRELAKQIWLNADTRLLEFGLALAAIEGARSDYRDLIVSLVLLRYAAERSGIEAKSFFDKLHSDKISSVLKNARDHSNSDVLHTVRTFGPHEWFKDGFFVKLATLAN